MMNVREIQFKEIMDDKGVLTPIEGARDIPFDIRRVYYITSVGKEMRRGFHAHRNLEQVLICLHGSVRIMVKMPDEAATYLLDAPSKGLYIGHMVWREMYDFSEGAVLLVLASEHYNEADYFRAYEEYEKEACSYFKEKIT